MEQAGGIFVAVVGASGVGKDAILLGAQPFFSDYPYYFPQRFITRPSDAGGEAHQAISLHDFAVKNASQEFCLSWRAHGLSYGIGAEALEHARGGGCTIVNLSRTVIAGLQSRFSNTVAIEIAARPDTISARLNDRDRETSTELANRRKRQIAPGWAGKAPVYTIHNDGKLEDAVEQFVTLIADLSGHTASTGTIA